MEKVKAENSMDIVNKGLESDNHHLWNLLQILVLQIA